MGNEQEWFRFAARLGADPAHIEHLVDTVQAGKWRKSASPRRYLLTTSEREFAQAKNTGQLDKPDIFNPLWNALDGTTRIVRDPGGVSKNGRFKKAGPEQPFCELAPASADNEKAEFDLAYDERASPPRYIPQNREEKAAYRFSLKLKEDILRRLSYDDWKRLRRTVLEGWDDDEIRILILRVEGVPLERHLKGDGQDAFLDVGGFFKIPSNARQLRAADRRVRRKLPKLRKKIWELSREGDEAWEGLY